MNLREKLQNHVNAYSKPAPIDVSSVSLTVSFVIPVFNSAKSIGLCLDTIATQQRRDLIKEIVLIDDGSSDDSWTHIRTLQKKYAGRLPIVTLRNATRRYAATTRNRGLQACIGDLVFFVDSDILLPPNYLVEHVWRHQTVGKCVTFSLRKDVQETEAGESLFPIASTNEFRNKLLDQYGDLSTVNFWLDEQHSLADLCLTCAVVYSRADLIRVKGCPENFVGWGFNDTAMAAKVIGLGRSVIPVMDCITGHLSHPPRSGTAEKKWSEYATNKSRYERMLELPMEHTFQYMIEALDQPVTNVTTTEARI